MLREYYNRASIFYKNSNKAQEFLRSSFWSIGGSLISKGLIFLIWIIVGRILGSEAYGEFGIIRNTAVMFASFTGLGLGITASKYVSSLFETDKVKTGRIIGLTLYFALVVGFLIGIGVFLLSPRIASSMLHAPKLTLDLQICSFILLFNSYNGAQLGVLQGLQSFKRIAVINLYQSVISAPLFILGALYGGVHGSVLAFTFYNTIICIFSHIAINRELKDKAIEVHLKDCWIERKILFTYSLPAFLSGLLVTPVKWLSDVMMVNSPNGFHEMGLFTATLTFNIVFLMMASMLDAPFLTILSKNQTDSINSSFNRFNIIAPWAVGLVIIIPFLIFPEVGYFLFGKTYVGDEFKWTFIFVLVFTLILLFKQGLARILAVYNMQWWGFVSNLIWGATLLISFYCLSSFGAVGLSLSYLLAYVVSTILILPIYMKRKLIPKNTIFSKYAYIIWGLVGIVVLFNFISCSILLRIFFLVAVYMLLFFLFTKYSKLS